MLNKSKVAVIRTRPENVLEDYQRLFELAGGSQALRQGITTILKDNISWHFPMPAANTTPWQLEGSILALRQAGFDDLVCVQNKTVVTDAFKGEDLNGYVPIFKHYNVPALYNFRNKGDGMDPLPAQGQNAGAGPHLPGRHPHPGFLLQGKTSSTCRRSRPTCTPPPPGR